MTGSREQQANTSVGLVVNNRGSYTDENLYDILCYKDMFLEQD